MQLNEVVASIPRARGSVLVLEGGSWVRRAFADVWHDVRVAIAFLRSIGLSARARVGVAAPNCYAWLVLDLACVAEGIVVVPFDAAAAEDFGAILADFELGALFVSGSGENCGSQRVFPLKGLLAGAAPAEAKSYRFSADDVFALRFTSGSTKTARAIEARAGSVNDSIVSRAGHVSSWSGRYDSDLSADEPAAAAILGLFGHPVRFRHRPDHRTVCSQRPNRQASNRGDGGPRIL